MKDKLRHFLAGFTIFHAVGVLLMVAGSFIGDAPGELLKKTDKLRGELKEMEKDCAAWPHKVKYAAHPLCVLAEKDIKAVRGAATSTHEAALKVIGFRASFDGLGFKAAFTVTFIQVVGAFVFFFEIFKLWLRGRTAKNKLDA
jgi:hypothetical protein